MYQLETLFKSNKLYLLDIRQRIARKLRVFETLQALLHLQLLEIRDKGPYKNRPWRGYKREIGARPFFHVKQ